MNISIFLSHKKQFVRVARYGRKKSADVWRLQYFSNHQPAARLGVIIPKRHVKSSVRRHRLSRIIRERFRQQWRASLPAVDILVQLMHSPPPRDFVSPEAVRLLMDKITVKSAHE